MKNAKENIARSNPKEMVRLGSGELTHNQIQIYLARGRYLQSAFAVNLLIVLWWKFRTGYYWIARSFATACGKMRDNVAILVYYFLRKDNKRGVCMNGRSKVPIGVDPSCT